MIDAVTQIMREVVEDTAARYGHDITYLFGDWSYISNTLTQWNTPETAAKKYPLIVLYSPFDELRGGERKGYEASLNLLILCNTRKEYTNEQREEFSFKEVLRPIYNAFLAAVADDRRIDTRSYRDVPEHTYRENYRYGRLGVLGADGKPFRDFIDAIEITKLNLTFNKICKK